MTNEEALKLIKRDWGWNPNASLEIQFMKNRYHHWHFIKYNSTWGHTHGMGKTLKQAFKEGSKNYKFWEREDGPKKIKV
jgi:hypothetical protein